MALADVATTIDNFMNAGPGLLWAFVCCAVVGIPLTLLHELGHAVVARARLGSEVRVTVGNAGQVGTVRLGGLITTLNLFQRPDRIGGAASFDAGRATARDMLWISLAGPAASLLGGLCLDVAYRHAPSGGVAHSLLWAAVLFSVFAVANLIPLRLSERGGRRPFNTDGMAALVALRTMSSGRSRDAAPAASPRSAPSRSAGLKTPAGRAQVGVRVWRHDDHLHVGVGTTHAFEDHSAVTATLTPDGARGLARALNRLADEADGTAGQRTRTSITPPRPDPSAGSVPPPGCADAE